ncbi:electron transport complex subunit E [Reinekea thalattae]|uniref:Ion-translocating oxidoreductase complex subunit E n=1 Tax=Reinekea thalattae TaxID=2593301 RepID=A0A5C8Z903_9GAMM|nr:electron transport complex subunit E [Reinekea thalattae]TXR53330.1 electron transport complex subunit E [Reinekea thalattae]
MSNSVTTLVKNGLWSNNAALVQILGLCPLLAVSGTVVNALGLGLATTVVLVGSNIAVSLIRNYVADAIRLPAFVMIIASFTTCAELLMQAYTYELYQVLGIFIPLIVTNCTILGRADAFARKNSLVPSIIDGLAMSFGFLVVLVILGAMREIIGQGTLFTNMHLIFGESARGWQINLFNDYPNFLFAVLPPGAFVGLGFLIAAKNAIDAYHEKRLAKQQTDEPKVSKRVRVTGSIS